MKKPHTDVAVVCLHVFTEDNKDTLFTTISSCVFRVNHLHYPPDGYEEDPEVIGYEDGDYGHDYHGDNRYVQGCVKSAVCRPCHMACGCFLQM